MYAYRHPYLSRRTSSPLLNIGPYISRATDLLRLPMAPSNLHYVVFPFSRKPSYATLSMCFILFIYFIPRGLRLFGFFILNYLLIGSNNSVSSTAPDDLLYIRGSSKLFIPRSATATEVGSQLAHSCQHVLLHSYVFLRWWDSAVRACWRSFSSWGELLFFSAYDILVDCFVNIAIMTRST